MTDEPVLVVGSTGMLGSQVATELLKRGRQVRALVRPGSDASALEAAGVEIARGDMMDPWSLLRALEGIDAVITSAAGYTRHRKGDTPKTDTVGNINLVEAASRSGVRRFVLTSILTCDQTSKVPHLAQEADRSPAGGTWCPVCGASAGRIPGPGHPVWR